MDTKIPAVFLAAISFALFFAGCTTGLQEQEPLPESFSAGHFVHEFEYTPENGFPKRLAVAVWYPSAGAETTHRYVPLVTAGKVALQGKMQEGAKFPLVIFSHGYGGCAVQSVFFTEALARNGYIVAAPDHADAKCSSAGKGIQLTEFDLSIFGEPEKFDDTTFADRKEDVEAVIGKMLELSQDKESAFFNAIDSQKIGMAGHSLGGYTALSMLGGWESWKDKRIKAAVLFSPYVKAHILSEKLSGIGSPIMLQGGTRDSPDITPLIEQLVFPALKPPKVFLILDGVGHMGWSNLSCIGKESTVACAAQNQKVRAINDYSIAFFDYYLKGKQAAMQRLAVKDSALSLLEYEFG
ncbi:MAG: alpha/beta hydrolase [Candidatus Diapherotrites archaeon]|nr:alpha/beta hydrolase [Candidatus Diapherotrites archaeon]